jgi:ribonuclease HII
MDEVGRGAPAGPVYVGVVVIDATVSRPLAGVRDSKLLTPAVRESLVPAVHRWAVDWAVGDAGAAEVDRHGLTGALRLAGHRALAGLVAPPDLVLLDGGHDWLTPPEGTGGPDAAAGARPAVTVVTRVRADLTCASVAAASVLAKVARDSVMVELARSFPGYGWEENKGYGTPTHLDALRRLGPTPHHRVTWRLPAVT